MSDRYQTDPFDSRPPRIVHHPALPPWLASRLLGSNEEVTWVRGPWCNPSWEWAVTHPALALIALGFAAFCLAIGWLLGRGSDLLPLMILVAGISVLGSIFVLAFFNGYFTRLVVTNRRLVIMQGYEIRHDWCVGEEHFRRANPGAIYMDCMPFIRGEQVTAEVADGPQSVIYDQAENRLHAQKAIMASLI